MRTLRLTQQPAPGFVGDRHSPELAPVDVGDAVVPRQPLVDERVVGVQEIHDAAVFAHDAVEEERRLFLHRLPKVVVEIGEGFQIRNGVLEIAQVQPLLGEVGDQRLRSRVCQHPLDLLFEHGGIFQLALARERQQLVVGKAAPEKERQPRRQREVVQPIDGVRRELRRVGFEAHQELRTRENELKRRLDAAIEGAAAGHAARPRDRSPSACRRSSCRRDGGKPPRASDDSILRGAQATSSAGAGRLADEDLAARGGIARAGRGRTDLRSSGDPPMDRP